MGNVLNKLTIFSLSLILMVSILSLSTFAQEYTATTLDWILLIAGGLIVIMGFRVFHALLKASNTYGGKLGSGLKRLCVGVTLVLFIAIIIGFFTKLQEMRIEVGYFWIITVIIGIFATYYTIRGARNIIDSSK